MEVQIIFKECYYSYLSLIAEICLLLTKNIMEKNL